MAVTEKVRVLSKSEELDIKIKRLAEQCKLDSWTSFVDEMKIPGDLYPALASGRAELLRLVQPRDLSADEAKVLLNIIATLMNTNMALREHAEQLALFTHNWADAFKQLKSVGERIERFANFELTNPEEE
jgi:hypothetical protein